MKLRTLIERAAAQLDAAGLAFGHGTANAHDEAAWLALWRLQLPLDLADDELERTVSAEQAAAVDALIAQRIESRQPAAYLTGEAWLQGLPFFVDERVIVPRSHIGEILFSEYLGEHGSSFLPDPMLVESAVDICTGSGCLAVLAAKFFPQASVDAVDLSADALEVAKLNLAEHDVEDQVTLFKGDLFAPLSGRTYDLIITNPPYVDHDALAGYPPEFRAEPVIAHDGGEDGLDLVRKILARAADHLNPGGGMICEIGSGREILEEEFPHLEFVWLETEQSQDAVFWISAEALGVS